MSLSRIGFVGLGKMGMPMSMNLLKAGYKLTVHDLRGEPVKQLVQAGATARENPREVAESSDVVMTSLPTPEALEQVTLGPEGILEGARHGLIHVILDTVTPSTVTKIVAQAAERGVNVLDAPVSGGPYGARERNLAIMVGGSIEIFQECRHILETIGNNIFYVGESGSGEVVKLVNNLLSLANVALVCEGITLGVRLGVDAKTLYEVVSRSTGRSFALEYKLPSIIAKRRFEGGFAIDLVSKDLGIILEVAKEKQVPLFLCAVVKQLYELAKARGHGEEDHTAIVKIFEEFTGVKVEF